MAEVDHSLPDDMTEAEAKQKIKEFIDGRQDALYEAVEGMITAAVEDAVKDVIRYGGVVALKTANQQFICAQDGGPEQSHKVFEFQSRDAIGPHESFEVLKP